MLQTKIDSKKCHSLVKYCIYGVFNLLFFPLIITICIFFFSFSNFIFKLLQLLLNGRGRALTSGRKGGSLSYCKEILRKSCNFIKQDPLELGHISYHINYPTTSTYFSHFRYGCYSKRTF